MAPYSHKLAPPGTGDRTRARDPMAVVLLWQRTATAWETMRPYSQGGTPHHPRCLSPKHSENSWHGG